MEHRFETDQIKTIGQRVVKSTAFNKTDPVPFSLRIHIFPADVADNRKIKNGRFYLRILSAHLQGKFTTVAADIQHFITIRKIVTSQAGQGFITRKGSRYAHPLFGSRHIIWNSVITEIVSKKINDP